MTVPASTSDAPTFGASRYPRVAYFCMEYGLDVRFTTYAGGLGILAGDHMKSIGDLHLPLVGLGLLWDEGYTQQRIGHDGHPEDHYPKTDRSRLSPVPVRIEVTVRGRNVPCVAWKVEDYTKATLYLLEPALDDDRWITRRLYGGGTEDRLAQEIILGVGGVRLLRALGHDVDVYHFNEGHAVFAGLELLRENRFGGTTIADRLQHLRPHVVFTTHTPVPAGNEVHSLDDMRRLDADLGFTDSELTAIGGSPFSMTVAGLRMSHMANAVAELHGHTARAMWKDVAGAAPITHVTNGVHVPTWQDARVRAALVAEKSDAERDAELWRVHQDMKAELAAEVVARTGVHVRLDRLLIGFARRAASYKRADLILADEHRLGRLLHDERIQLIYSGKAHPRDGAGKALVSRLVAASRRWPGKVIFVENYDMTLGALLTRGCDVWLNNPRRPLEASGTSGMKAAMNGVLNLSILDGWWPEGCHHGETGWKIGDPDAADDAVSTYDGTDPAPSDDRDRNRLYDTLEREVMPVYYDDRGRWLHMMKASIAMSQWRFSSDRMVQEYFARMYRPS
ncbi:MAG: alpha-glucan family phosphorylase [Kofleriaceae bacterium]|nr:alpha-glucan family phosphorylase [Myxococcales bacterium]MCB9565520.1 alpha-glucan family phosphorylase [Kofleriaceae bacterium]